MLRSLILIISIISANCFLFGSNDTLFIKEGVGINDVEFGDSKSKVIEVFGKAYTLNKHDEYIEMDYPDLKMSFFFSVNDSLEDIYLIIDEETIAKTSKGVIINADLKVDDLLTDYGSPMWSYYVNGGVASCYFDRYGLDFEVLWKDDSAKRMSDITYDYLLGLALKEVNMYKPDPDADYLGKPHGEIVIVDKRKEITFKKRFEDFDIKDENAINEYYSIISTCFSEMWNKITQKELDSLLDSIPFMSSSRYKPLLAYTSDQENVIKAKQFLIKYLLKENLDPSHFYIKKDIEVLSDGIVEFPLIDLLYFVYNYNLDWYNNLLQEKTNFIIPPITGSVSGLEGWYGVDLKKKRVLVSYAQ